MSRIGRKPISIPKGVEVRVLDGNVLVKGPLGQLQWGLSPGIEASVENEEVSLSRNNDSAKLKALHGLTRAELANQLKGVKDGFPGKP